MSEPSAEGRPPTAVSRVTGELNDPALERAFLEANLPETRRRLRVCWLFVVATALLYAGKDSLSLEGWRVTVSLLSRLLSVAPGLVWLVWQEPRSAVQLQRRAFWSCLAFIPGFVGVQGLYDEISLMSPMWFSMLMILNGLWLAHSFRGLVITNSLIFLSGVLSFAWLSAERLDRVVGVTVLQVAAFAFSIAAPAMLNAARRQEYSTLLAAFPASVVSRLLSGKPVTEHHEAVTVMFADLVGFTSLAERLPPVELLPVLAELFAAFDQLAAAHGVEPIKTVGDCYMAAAGVPEAVPEPVRRAADLALAMQRCVAERRFGGQQLRLRIGLHVGPLVAGVVGARRQLYDLWGDTVNVASRLESHGLPGEIQVSGAVVAALGEGYRVEPRGRVELKGREAMEVWLLKEGPG